MVADPAWDSIGVEDIMRLIGHFTDRMRAEQASGVLASHDIRHRMEPEDGQGWALWVHSEDDLAHARELQAAFLAQPDDPKFRMPPGAGTVPEMGLDDPGSGAVPAKPDILEAGGSAAMGLATIAITGLCIALAFVTGLGETRGVMERLMIAEVPYRWGASWALFLPEVRHGEIWRLVSPMFLHFGWPHIAFNLLAFWGLGRMIERRRGSMALVWQVLAFGLISNLGQYLARGPSFGGLSGVVYGLVGYVWMMGRYRPSAGLVLQPQVVLMMLVWFAIGANGSMDMPMVRASDGAVRGVQGVANAAHGMGLLVGMAWGRWVAWRKV